MSINRQSRTSVVPAVSLVIVTRNRAQTLAKCLAALAVQTSEPAELVVIDNASTDETAKVVKQFQAQVSWPVRRVVEPRLGYPVVYNAGLRAAQADWVIFIDDDCVAAPGWLRAFQPAIAAAAGTPTAALVGQSQTQQPATVWALAVLLADQLWKRNAIDTQGRITDLETLDNKNIAYYRPFLRQHKLAFNEAALSQPGLGAAEDADLGMQLAVHGARAQYVAEAVVWHQDPKTFLWYWRRLLSGAKANFWYRRRWQATRISLGLETAGRSELRAPLVRWRLRSFWPVFCQEQKLRGLQAAQVWGVVVGSFLWLQFYYKWLTYQAKVQGLA